MIEEPDDGDFDDDKIDIDEVTIIDKIDILLTLIENGPKERYKALAVVLEEARFHLLHALNEAQYYSQLCDGYEKTIKQIGDRMK